MLQSKRLWRVGHDIATEQQHEVRRLGQSGKKLLSSDSWKQTRESHSRHREQRCDNHGRHVCPGETAQGQSSMECWRVRGLLSSCCNQISGALESSLNTWHSKETRSDLCCHPRLLLSGSQAPPSGLLPTLGRHHMVSQLSTLYQNYWVLHHSPEFPAEPKGAETKLRWCHFSTETPQLNPQGWADSQGQTKPAQWLIDPSFTVQIIQSETTLCWEHQNTFSIFRIPQGHGLVKHTKFPWLDRTHPLAAERMGGQI